jgi:predicted phage terminase large subunit-like protein
MVKRLTDRDAFVRIEWIPSIQDKETRATSIQGLMSMGKVFWPKNAKWKAHVQEQMLRFPAGKYNDAVDVMGLFGRGLKFVQGNKKPALRRIMEPVKSWMAG